MDKGIKTPVTFADLRVRFGTFRSIPTRNLYAKRKYETRQGMMCALGDLEISEWTSLITQLIQESGEQELQDQLYEYIADPYPWANRKEEALELHAARIFDDPLWVNFVDFNRKYRPEVLKTVPLAWVTTNCCKKPGLTTQAQVDKAAAHPDRLICCPHCEVWSGYEVVEEKYICV